MYLRYLWVNKIVVYRLFVEACRDSCSGFDFLLFVFVADNFAFGQTKPQEHVGAAVIEYFKTSAIKNNFDNQPLPLQQIPFVNFMTIPVIKSGKLQPFRTLPELQKINIVGIYCRELPDILK